MKRLQYFPCLWKTANTILIPEPKNMPTLSVIHHLIRSYQHSRRHSNNFCWLVSSPWQMAWSVKTISGVEGTFNYFSASKSRFSAADITSRHQATLFCWTSAKPLTNLAWNTNTVHLIRSHLTARAFRIRINGACSRVSPVDTSFPHESISLILTTCTWTTYQSILESRCSSSLTKRCSIITSCCPGRWA